MGLIIPNGPSWAYSAHTEYNGSGGGNGYVTLTSDSTANTDGSVVTLLAALSFDVEFLILSFRNSASSAVDTAGLADIMIDPAGGTSWQSFIDDLLCGNVRSSSFGEGGPRVFYFPVWIPAGASVGARWRWTGSGLRNIRATAIAVGGNRNPASWWCGQKVTSIGVNPSTSKGTTHTPGAGSFSSWADCGSVLPLSAKAFQFAVGGSDSSSNFSAYYYEFGINDNRIGAPMTITTTTVEECAQLIPFPTFFEAPAGAQLRVRASCFSGTSEDQDVAAYAVS